MYLAAFIAGLVVWVFLIFSGVERRPGRGETSSPTVRMAVPLFAAFAMIMGLAGYVLSRGDALSTRGVLLVSMGLGAIGLAAAAFLIARSAHAGQTRPHDESFDLQGHFARV